MNKLTDTSKKAYYSSTSLLRAYSRLALFLILSVCHGLRLSIIGTLNKDRDNLAEGVRLWSNHVNKALGVRIRSLGPQPQKGSLIVSNHRSYIDITVLGASAPCSFLAKEELRSWPLLGPAAEAGNTVFVKRGSTDSGHAAKTKIADLLAMKISVTVFPEGTTFRGPGIMPFRKGIFDMASDIFAPVSPAAVDYEDPDDAWVDDDTFISHFIRVFRKKNINVIIKFGNTIACSDSDVLRSKCESWISDELQYLY